MMKHEKEISREEAKSIALIYARSKSIHGVKPDHISITNSTESRRSYFFIYNLVDPSTEKKSLLVGNSPIIVNKKTGTISQHHSSSVEFSGKEINLYNLMRRTWHRLFTW